jgi:hypothetical protein
MSSIIITPYATFGPLELGKTTKHECVALLGEPLRTQVSNGGAEEFVYEQFIVRFDPKKAKVRECTLLPRAKATINGIAVTWDKCFLHSLCEQDRSPRDVYGFIVFPSLGLAVTGVHDGDESQLAVTVFSEGEFDDLLPESMPFTGT